MAETHEHQHEELNKENQKPENENQQAEKQIQDEDSDDHDHQEGGEGAGKEHKASRGEKKFKKAMTKLGMKPVTGINRVTIKRAKSLLLYIDDPEVLKSPGQDNSYIIFGEAKIPDYPANIGQDEAKKFQHAKEDEHGHDHDHHGHDHEHPHPEQAVAQEQPKQEQPQENKAEGGDEEDATGIDEATIATMMDQGKCTRNQAIKALKASKGDLVNAILSLS